MPPDSPEDPNLIPIRPPLVLQLIEHERDMTVAVIEHNIVHSFCVRATCFHDRLIEYLFLRA